jgi:hypothetical protein
VSGRILVWEPPHVFEHGCYQAIVGHGVVRYEPVADGEETVLTFTHRGLGPRDASGFVPGTHAYLDRLAAHLVGSDLPDRGERHAEVEPAYR